MNRLLLAMAFLPTGLVKLTGQRFTIPPVDIVGDGLAGDAQPRRTRNG